MGIYGNNVAITESNIVPIQEDTSFGNIECVSFVEFENYRRMFEECTDESTRTILEAKVEVLQEVSFTEIKENIKKVIGKMIQFVKDIIKKIKEFFTDKKKSYYKKKCQDLENELKKSKAYNETLKADNSSYKKDNEFLKQQNDSLKDENKKAQDKNDRYRHDIADLYSVNKKLTRDASSDAQKYIDSQIENDKLKDENESLKDNNAKLVKAAEKIISNDYLYFDMYDFIVDNFEPEKFVKSSDYDDVFGMISFKRKNPDNIEKDEIKQRLESWLDNKSKYFNIIKSGVLPKDINLRLGGYNHREVHEAIKEHISKVPRCKNIKTLMDRVEWLTHGFQVSASNEIMVSYQKMLSNLESILFKYFNQYDRVAQIDPKYLEDEKEVNDYNSIYGEFVRTVRDYIRIIDNSVRFASVISNYAGRACGAAYQAIDVLSIVYGLSS